MKKIRLVHAEIQTPLGGFHLALENGAVTDAGFYGSRRVFLRAMREKYGHVEFLDDRGALKSLSRELGAYFSGNPVSFSVKTAPTGTPFQKRVWEALKRIPRGRTMSYGEVARAVGTAGGARAVGGACGANPVPVLIPCHRVLKSDGSLGGYSGGRGIKKKLLAIEGAVHGRR